MKERYDLLILNNCPAFYKINLYNEIAKKRKIFVIFLGHYDQVTIDDNFEELIKFPYKLINTKQLKQRNICTSFLAIRKAIKSFTFQKIIYGGYVEPEFIMYSFFFSKKKNVLQTESASETRLSGARFYLKRILLSRFSKALASGSVHRDMLRKMFFNNEVILTMGVGLVDKPIRDFSSPSEKSFRFLYVGRIIELKNLRNLIDVFNKNGLPLTIVGNGLLFEELKNKSKNNISWLGIIENKQLNDIYKNHHIFILPSFSEAWGLVVEEAIYRNCAIVISNKVGCLNELVSDPRTGVSFNPDSTDDMQIAINKVMLNYCEYSRNAEDFDFVKKDAMQIAAYSDGIFK